MVTTFINICQESYVAVHVLMIDESDILKVHVGTPFLGQAHLVQAMVDMMRREGEISAALEQANSEAREATEAANSATGELA